jgi:hypothetical protein
MYQYHGLPMGLSNSPALAGQYGTAFLILLREQIPLFQGSFRENTWFLAFDDGQEA